MGNIYPLLHFRGDFFVSPFILSLSVIDFPLGRALAATCRASISGFGMLVGVILIHTVYKSTLYWPRA